MSGALFVLGVLPAGDCPIQEPSGFSTQGKKRRNFHCPTRNQQSSIPRHNRTQGRSSFIFCVFPCSVSTENKDECKEETGLDVTFVDGFRVKDEHNLAREGRPNTIKQTIYFLAKYEEQEFGPQESEISQIVLMDFETAMATLQFDSFKHILTQAHSFLEQKHC